MDEGDGLFPSVDPALGDLPDETLRALAPVAASSAVGDLARGIAHELNNSLFGIVGLVELLLDEEGLDPKVAGQLELVRSTALEMRRTADVVQELARPGRADGSAVLDETAGAVVDAFRRTSMAPRLEIVERYPEHRVHVRAGAAVLEQVILQLLLHARRAAGETGGIEVEVGADGETALLRVRGGGAGPRPEAGLGLLVARALARAHGGSLEAEAPDRLLLRLPRRP